jgi:hypothetical protein
MAKAVAAQTPLRPNRKAGALRGQRAPARL